MLETGFFPGCKRAIKNWICISFNDNNDRKICRVLRSFANKNNIFNDEGKGKLKQKHYKHRSTFIERNFSKTVQPKQNCCSTRAIIDLSESRNMNII